MKPLSWLVKVTFALLVILPLLLIVGAICLIEEYIILNPLWVKRYAAGAINSFPLNEFAFLGQITKIEVKRSSGGTANMVRRLDVWLADQNKPTQLLFKKYLLFGSLFSFLGYFLGPYPPSKVTPGQRQDAEEAALECFSRIGIAVPRILFIDYQRRISFFQFVEGVRIDRLILEYIKNKKEHECLSLFYQYGSCLAKIHNAGWSLIDGNPFNFKYSCREGRIYFTDLELAVSSNHKSWDIANALNLIQNVFKDAAAAKVKEHFLNGYASVISSQPLRGEVEGYLKKLKGYNLLNKYLPHINFE